LGLGRNTPSLNRQKQRCFSFLKIRHRHILSLRPQQAEKFDQQLADPPDG